MSKYSIYKRTGLNINEHVCDIVVKSAAHAVNYAQINLGKNNYFIVPR